MSDDRVRALVEEVLATRAADMEAHRFVLQAVLEQFTKEVAARLPYDFQQRRRAIEQILLRDYHRRGQVVPELATKLMMEHVP